MSFWSRLTRSGKPKEAPPPPDDPLASVRWIPAGESPFGVEVLDCRGFALTMISTTKDSRNADDFLRLRGSTGEEYLGRSPEDAATCACDLRYPQKGPTRDGPLFKAGEMEDKWDIYHYDGHLYFARSWTGGLEFRAAIEFSSDEAHVVAVEARRRMVEGDPSYVVSAVDFLIRSHLYRLTVPHPLPPDFGRDPRELALFSFSHWGRHGLFGAFGDTTRLPAEASD